MLFLSSDAPQRAAGQFIDLRPHIIFTLFLVYHFSAFAGNDPQGCKNQPAFFIDMLPLFL